LVPHGFIEKLEDGTFTDVQVDTVQVEELVTEPFEVVTIIFPDEAPATNAVI
jgi:hypothetical protein